MGTWPNRRRRRRADVRVPPEKGMKFHDGREVTSKDVKATIDYIMNPANKSNFQISYSVWVGANNDPDVFDLVFSSKRIPPNGASREHHRNPWVDRLIDGIRMEMNQEKRKELCSEVQKLLALLLVHFHPDPVNQSIDPRIAVVFSAGPIRWNPLGGKHKVKDVGIVICSYPHRIRNLKVRLVCRVHNVIDRRFDVFRCHLPPIVKLHPFFRRNTYVSASASPTIRPSPHADSFLRHARRARCKSARQSSAIGRPGHNAHAGLSDSTQSQTPLPSRPTPSSRRTRKRPVTNHRPATSLTSALSSDLRFPLSSL